VDATAEEGDDVRVRTHRARPVAARSRYPEVTAPVQLIYGEKDWSRPSDRQANRHLLPAAEFTEVRRAGHFIALERPDVPAELLNSAA
jgi:pimeloyl-ACP methyl ester carboxylesterase